MDREVLPSGGLGSFEHRVIALTESHYLVERRRYLGIDGVLEEDEDLKVAHFISCETTLVLIILLQLHVRAFLTCCLVDGSLQPFMYSEREANDIKLNLPVGTTLRKKDPRVCHNDPSSAYRLRAGDHIAVPEGDRSYRVYEVIDTYVEFGESACFTAKCKKFCVKRHFQYRADLIHKLNLTPACNMVANRKR